MEDATPRPCLSCGVVYPSHEEFLCDECAVPGKIIMTCACGRRCEVVPKSLDCRLLSEKVGVPLVPGMAIHVAGCAKCGAAGIKRPMSIFQLKECGA